MQQPTPVLESSIHINATPEKVWAVVSDVRRITQWSPQVRKTIAFGNPKKVGTRLLNINRQGWKFWPTTSVISVFDANTTIAYRIAENNTQWSFTLTEVTGITGATSTQLIQRRQFAPGATSTTTLSKVLIDRFLGGSEDLERRMLLGMKQTLAGIKAAAEA